jgi:predicted alpha/beta-fold hydrolase
VGTRLVNFEHVDAPLPPRAPHGDWRVDLATLLERYQSAPVLAPEDERLEPVFGGLTTLSYFGADAKPRVRDQQIPKEPRAAGQSLELACAAPVDERAEVVLATSGLPAFSPVWVPLSSTGGSAPEAARCDERGQPSGAEDSFCVFGRLALQPTRGRALIVVVHGLFDSGAQEYVQRMAAVLYRLGHSVLIPDMRDHGDTLRAAPELATTLGTLEGPDLLAMVQAARHSCGDRIGRAGISGVSGGGLAAIRAFTLDREGSLDAGVIAVSPLIDVASAIHDLSQTGACPITRSVELSWTDTALLAGVSGAAFFGGAALTRALDDQRLDATTAIVAGIGAGVGLLTGLVVDSWLDGGTEPCVGQRAMSRIVEDVLKVRWRSLQPPELGRTMSPTGRRMDASQLELGDYVRERVQFLATERGLQLSRFDARSLARDLHVALAPRARRAARLFVIGAEDDPMMRPAALRDFISRTRDLPQVHAHAVPHGGHGAMWVVQPAIMTGMFERFFDPR